MEVFFKANHTKYKQATTIKSDEWLFSNVMGLLYFVLMQNQRLYYSTEINILKGHEKVVWDMQDVIYKLEDRVISFTTWLYTVAEGHI